jgi:hypothetical protein
VTDHEIAFDSSDKHHHDGERSQTRQRKAQTSPSDHLDPRALDVGWVREQIQGLRKALRAKEESAAAQTEQRQADQMRIKDAIIGIFIEEHGGTSNLKPNLQKMIRDFAPAALPHAEPATAQPSTVSHSQPELTHTDISAQPLGVEEFFSDPSVQFDEAVHIDDRAQAVIPAGSAGTTSRVDSVQSAVIRPRSKPNQNAQAHIVDPDQVDAFDFLNSDDTFMSAALGWVDGVL